MEEILTSIAETIRLADRVAGVQVVLADPPREAARAMGTAGFSPDPAFPGLLRDCRSRGARLATFDEPATLDQRVLTGRRDRMLGDGSWLPMHGYLRQVEWRDYVATPIPLHRERGGVINCYVAADADVTPRLLEFLRGMARLASALIEPREMWREPAPALQRGADRVGRLTPRERDVLALLGTGLSNQALADELGLSERTARTHVSNILAKLDLTSRTQAALVARLLQ